MPALWATQHGGRGVYKDGKSSFSGFKMLLSSFHRNQRGSVSNAVPRFNIRSLVRTGKYLKMHQDMFLVVTPQSRKSTYSRLIRPLNPKLTELIC